MERGIGIGQLAKQTNTKVPTVRYYEQIGMLPEPGRTSGNQRRYTQEHVSRLAFIRHSRDLGFSLDAIRDLLTVADDPNQPCEVADQIARRQIDDIDVRIGQLTALRGELERMVEQCAGGKIENCRVIEVLSDHSQCSVEEH